MRAPEPTSAARREGARLLGVRAAAAAFGLLLAAPLLATVWTRSNLMVRIPKGGRAELENASYSGRDWSVALTALEVREDPRAEPGVVTTVWVFHYTNTDKDPHYVSLNIRCLDATRNERSRFVAKATLEGDRPKGDRVEVRAKLQEPYWNASAWAKVVVDFLSTPEG